MSNALNRRTNKNTITLKIGSFEMTLPFRSGGDITGGIVVRRDEMGGMYLENPLAAYECTGVIEIPDSSVYNALKQAYEQQLDLADSAKGATHSSYAAYGKGLKTTTMFKNVSITQYPQMAISDFGGQPAMTLTLSLAQIINHSSEDGF
jgi:hypothetical protein